MPQLEFYQREQIPSKSSNNSDKGKKAKKKQKGPQPQITKDGVLFTTSRTLIDDKESLTFDKCSELGERLVIVATQPFRYLMLGLEEHEDASENSITALGAQHYCALETIGKASFDGVLQTDLSKALRIAPKDLFVVLRHLERRNLIHRERSAVGSSSNGLNTNCIWLNRFADITMHPWASGITTSREHILQKELDKLTIKGKLGRIRREKVQQQKQASQQTMLLLKTSVDEIEDESSDQRTTSRCNLYKELSIIDQLYREVDKGGKDGVFGTDLYKDLGICSKLAHKLLATIKKNYNIVTRADTLGKSLAYRLTTKENAEGHTERTVLGLIDGEIVPEVHRIEDKSSESTLSQTKYPVVSSEQTPGKRTPRPDTLQFHRRRDLILDRIKNEPSGMVTGVEIRRAIREMEGTVDQTLGKLLLDQRTSNRLFNTMADSGLVKLLSVSVPRLNHGHRQELLLLDPSMDIKDPSVRKLAVETASNVDHHKKKHPTPALEPASEYLALEEGEQPLMLTYDTPIANATRSCARLRARSNSACEPTPEVLAEIIESATEQVAYPLLYGYIRPKMARARLLFRFLWDLTEERRAQQPSGSEEEMRSFTYKVLCDELPLKYFLQLVGATEPEKIPCIWDAELHDVRTADLPAATKSAVMAVQHSSRSSRLRGMLSILSNLGLLEVDEAKANGQASEKVQSSEDSAGHVYRLTHRTQVGDEEFELIDKKSRDAFWQRLKQLLLFSKECPGEHHPIRLQYPESKHPELYWKYCWTVGQALSEAQCLELDRLEPDDLTQPIPLEDLQKAARAVNTHPCQVAIYYARLFHFAKESQARLQLWLPRSTRKRRKTQSTAKSTSKRRRTSSRHGHDDENGDLLASHESLDAMVTPKRRSGRRGGKSGKGRQSTSIIPFSIARQPNGERSSVRKRVREEEESSGSDWDDEEGGRWTRKVVRRNKWKRHEDEQLLEAYAAWVDKYFAHMDPKDKPDVHVSNPLTDPHSLVNLPDDCPVPDAQSLSQFAASRIPTRSMDQCRRRFAWMRKKASLSSTSSTFGNMSHGLTNTAVTRDLPTHPKWTALMNILKVITLEPNKQYDPYTAHRLLEPFNDGELAHVHNMLQKDRWFVRTKSDYQTVRSWRLSWVFYEALRVTYINANVFDASDAFKSSFRRGLPDSSLAEDAKTGLKLFPRKDYIPNQARVRRHNKGRQVEMTGETPHRANESSDKDSRNPKEGGHVAALLSLAAQGQTRLVPVMRPDKYDRDRLPVVDVALPNMSTQVELVGELASDKGSENRAAGDQSCGIAIEVGEDAELPGEGSPEDKTEERSSCGDLNASRSLEQTDPGRAVLNAIWSVLTSFGEQGATIAEILRECMKCRKCGQSECDCGVETRVKVSLHQSGSKENEMRPWSREMVSQSLWHLLNFRLVVRVLDFSMERWVASGYSKAWTIASEEGKDDGQTFTSALTIGEPIVDPYKQYETRKQQQALLSKGGPGPDGSNEHGSGDPKSASNEPDPSMAVGLVPPDANDAGEDSDDDKHPWAVKLGSQCGTLEDNRVVIHPWIMLDGSVNTSFLASINNALLSLVVHRPGISLEAVTRRFPVLTPAEIVHILGLLEIDGKVTSRKMRERAATFASCFGSDGQESSNNRKSKWRTYYFPTTDAI